MQVNCTKVLILQIIGEICRKHIGKNNYLHQKFETLELSQGIMVWYLYCTSGFDIHYIDYLSYQQCKR